MNASTTPPPDEIPDLNLFMICRKLNPGALCRLPDDFRIRNCRKDELDLWMAMPFDDPAEAIAYRGFMSDYFQRTYASKSDLFFRRCYFVCNRSDRPVATAFIWKAYDEFNTVHWLKVLKEHEGRGIGRALLSFVLQELNEGDFPVYLHTQPGSFRAIKLYSDFGFDLLLDPVIGPRKNDLQECLPILEKHMPSAAFRSLRFTNAPEEYLRFMESVEDDQF